jgi:PAS domain S-box-containing protein
MLASTERPGKKPALLLLVVCIAATVASLLIVQARADDVKRVLVFHSNQSVLPATVIGDTAIRRELQSVPPYRVEVYSEFLDTERFPEPEQAARMERFLRDKYAGHHLDAIIATGTHALDFLIQRRTSLFEDAPVIFAGVSEEDLQARHLPAGFTGVIDREDPGPTLDLALRLQPKARQVFVVLGAATVDLAWEDTIASLASAYKSRLQVRRLTGLPMGDLVKKLGQLPADSFVLYLTMFRDGVGQAFLPRDVAERVSAAASVPVYGIYDTYLGRGIVGGSMVTFDSLGTAAGQLTKRLLLAGAGAGVPPVQLVATANIVDWRQLRRWRIPEERLPAGTEVRFREPSIWDLYKWQIVAAGVLLAAQTALIVALLIQGRRRRRAEASLQESEERMELAAVSAHIGLWHWDIVPDRIWATDACREMIGLAADAPATLEHFLGAVQADQHEATVRSFRDAAASGSPLRRTWRMAAPDGSERWISATARTRFEGSGRAPRMMGVLIDVTQERQAQMEAQQRQQELTHLSRVATLGELSGAIAHELNQPLTAILSNAQAARLILAGDRPDLAEINDIVDDIVADGRRAGEVMQRLRTMFRKADALLEPLDLNEVAAEVLELVHGELIERRVRVARDLAPDLPAIRGDRVQLKQVLLNIVMNACDAMSDNGPGERDLMVATARGETGMVQVAVTDRGGGIEAPLMERLFEPFVTTKAKGLGLGLSICRSIVTAHGGRLWAANNHDTGATFWVALPADLERRS